MDSFKIPSDLTTNNLRMEAVKMALNADLEIDAGFLRGKNNATSQLKSKSCGELATFFSSTVNQGRSELAKLRTYQPYGSKNSRSPVQDIPWDPLTEKYAFSLKDKLAQLSQFSGYLAGIIQCVVETIPMPRSIERSNFTRAGLESALSYFGNQGKSAVASGFLAGVTDVKNRKDLEDISNIKRHLENAYLTGINNYSQIRDIIVQSMAHSGYDIASVLFKVKLCAFMAGVVSELQSKLLSKPLPPGSDPVGDARKWFEKDWLSAKGSKFTVGGWWERLVQDSLIEVDRARAKVPPDEYNITFWNAVHDLALGKEVEVKRTVQEAKNPPKPLDLGELWRDYKWPIIIAGCGLAVISGCVGVNINKS